MAFSFYSSLKSIPRELREARSIYRFSRWQRFLQLELPYGDHRAGVELHGLGGRRLVFPDGLRDVRAGQARFPAARPGLVSANGRQRMAIRAAIVWGLAAMIARDRADRSVGLAAADCVVRQVQVRAGGERERRTRPCCTCCAARALLALVRAARHTSRVGAARSDFRAASPRDEARALEDWRRAARSRLAGVVLLLLIAGCALFHARAGAQDGHRRRIRLDARRPRARRFLRVKVALMIASAVDHSRGRRHRLQPASGADRAAAGANCGVGSRHRAVPVVLLCLMQHAAAA